MFESNPIIILKVWGPDTSVADIFDAVEATIHDAELVPQVCADADADAEADADVTINDAQLVAIIALINRTYPFYGRLKVRWPTWSFENMSRLLSDLLALF